MTDHHSLCWHDGLMDSSGRPARWVLRLQEYNITLVYNSRQKHNEADSLLRNLLYTDTLPSVKDVPDIARVNLSSEQLRDPYLARIMCCQGNSTNGSTENCYKPFEDIFCKRNYDPSGKKWLSVIPKYLCREILEHFHDAPIAGHLAFMRTYDKLRRRF